MNIPDYVNRLIEILEAAGHACYAVGGCVRDSVQGLPPHDYDLCTDASPEEMKALFADFSLVLAGEKHGTVGVSSDGQLVEITTFRKESGYADHRHPDRVAFVSDIRSDLARRDFTVNAMAWSPKRGFADPFGGRADLESRILRAVGDPETRFREDSLRILRGVRFAVRYGLTPEKKTLEAMLSLAPLMETLARERVFSELCGLLPYITAGELQRYAPILTQVIPELGPAVGFAQHCPYHAYDVYTHTAHVVEAMPPELTLRWAALLHDVAKPAVFTRDETGRGHFYGHDSLGGEMADAILRRLKSPTVLREDVVFLIRHHMTPLEPERKLLLRRLNQYGPRRVQWLLTLQNGDFCSKGVKGDGPDFALTGQMLEKILEEKNCLSLKDLAVSGRDLLALGYSGPEIGRKLEGLLNLVVEEALPNEKNALLEAAKQL